MYKNEVTLSLYEEMYRIRHIEQNIARIYPKGFFKTPVHLSIGQEAVAVGVASLLEKGDYITSNHRCHAHYLAKGGSLSEMLLELAGFEDGCCNSWGGSQHLRSSEINMPVTTAILGGGHAIGTGYGLSIKMKNEKRISVIFLGDGSTEEGIFYESVNFAQLHNLPVLYVCENNLLATHSRIEKRRPSNFSFEKLINSFDINFLSCDGNDVLDVREKTNTLINEIKKGNGPAFLLSNTYRWYGHVSPIEDFAEGYREKEEIDLWKEKCPIKKLKNKLLLERKEEYLSSVENKILDEIEKSFHNILSKIDKRNQNTPKVAY